VPEFLPPVATPGRGGQNLDDKARDPDVGRVPRQRLPRDEHVRLEDVVFVEKHVHGSDDDAVLTDQVAEPPPQVQNEALVAVGRGRALHQFALVELGGETLGEGHVVRACELRRLHHPKC